MFWFSIAFLCGDLLLQTFTHLPEKNWVFCTVLIVFFIWIGLRFFWYRAYLILGVLLGFVWTFWFAQSLLSWTLPKEIEGQTIDVIGRIASLPVMKQEQVKFIFALHTLQFQNKKWKTNTKIFLTWRNPQGIRVGDEWKLGVRLKRIHSTQNPGSFDFEAWALQKGIRASGYILENRECQFLKHHAFAFPIEQIRQKHQQKMQRILPQHPTSHWLYALMLGIHQDISRQDWQILRNTGTNHLMAIAGLHIGTIAGFAHFLFSMLWRRCSRAMLWVPAQQIGAISALIAALFYSALAGFSLPTQRACIMLVAFIVVLLLRRKINSWQCWSLALFLVLSLNPLSVLTESFWLSFATLALILFGMRGRLNPTGFWWKWGRVQWIIGAGLIPLTLFFFQECSFISFVANSIAIPWLAFLILPFCFLSTISLFFSTSLAHFFISIADQSLVGLWWLLTSFSQSHFSSWNTAFSQPSVFIFTMIGVLLILAPKALPGKWLGLIWIMPLFFTQSSKPHTGEMWMNILDVGQGLAIVVQTQNHVLVYDTGPQVLDIDMGERVVLPFLVRRGIKKIDMLVISHEDNDHIGGAQTLLNAMPVKTIRSNHLSPLFSKHEHKICLAGMSWEWDQVRFTFLYPGINQLNLRNNSSCVLKIENGQHRILLTGDIEKKAEKYLLEQSDQLKSDVIVVPHHGSKTSSSFQLIQAVRPRFVFYSFGYRNRYHFPNKNVVRRYEKLHAKQFNTSTAGAIEVRISKNPLKVFIESYREKHRHYWNDV